MTTVIDLTVDSDDDGLEVVEEQISRSDEGQEQFTNIVEEHSEKGSNIWKYYFQNPSKITHIKTEERFR